MSLQFEIPKVLFTNGDDFTLTGSDYIGYLNVFNGKAFRGKFDKNVELTRKNTLNSSLILDETFTDNTLFDQKILRNDSSKVFFQPNEIINKNSINSKLEFLYDNFLGLVNLANFDSPRLPIEFTNITRVSGVAPPIAGSPSAPQRFAPVRFNTSFTPLNVQLSTFSWGKISPSFAGNNDKRLITMRGRFDDKYITFFAGNSSLLAYEIEDNQTQNSLNLSLNLVASASEIGTQNGLTLDVVNSIYKGNNNTLFISDSAKKTIYEVDVTNIVNDDRSGVKEFKLIKSIGGTGDKNSNFSSIKDLYYLNNNLFVLDDNTNELKMFDKDFNFLRKYKNDGFFNLNKPISVTADLFTNYVYILTNTYKILILNSTDLNEIKRIDLNDTGDYEQGDAPVDIAFSQNNSNTYFLLTKRFCYKLIKRTNTIVGIFKFDGPLQNINIWDSVNDFYNGLTDDPLDNWDFTTDSFSTVFNSFDIIGSNNRDDDIITLNFGDVWLTTRDKLQKINFLDLNNTNFFEKEDILLKDEYFNNITLNTSIYKILYNVNLLGICVNKKVNLKFESGILTFDRIFNIIPEEKKLLKIENINEFYIGNNEPLSFDSFNRPMEKLLNLEEKILSLLNFETTNTKITPLTTLGIE